MERFTTFIELPLNPFELFICIFHKSLNVPISLLHAKCAGVEVNEAQRYRCPVTSNSLIQLDASFSVGYMILFSFAATSSATLVARSMEKGRS